MAIKQNLFRHSRFAWRAVLGIVGASCLWLSVAEADTYAPNLLPDADYKVIQNSITNLGMQSDGLILYDFNFTFTNRTSSPLQSIYVVIPRDPALSFGETVPTWDPVKQQWSGYSSLLPGTLVAKPSGIAGYLDPTTPQFPMYLVASYIGANASVNYDVRFEIDPQAGQFWFSGDVVTTPIPPSIILLATALLGLGLGTRKRWLGAAA